MASVVALDVGGTVLKGWACTREGAEVRRLERPAAAHEGPAAVVRAIADTVTELADDSTVAAGVVVPGVVDQAAGVARYSANLGWRDVPLRALLTDRLGVPVTVGHDVRAGALAEWRMGAATDAASALFVPVGTGIAGAVVVGGTSPAGATGAAGEIGHVVVAPGGEACPCGQLGCVEAYASAAAIARRYRRRTGRDITARQLVARLPDDLAAEQVWQEAVDALALGLLAAVMLLDPERIVVGGGLARAGRTLLDPLDARLRALLRWREPPRIVPAALGDAAGRYGAAMLAWQVAGHQSAGIGWRADDDPGIST